jgi:hypothetical protein
MVLRVIALTVVFCCTALVQAADKDPYKSLSPGQRQEAIRHAQVWFPTDIPSLNIKAGPKDANGFAPGATVTCEFVAKEQSGATPKFTCAVGPDDEVKVKYGERNGEVYGEVAATRLLWALGFGADRMYPVKVLCRGCSADPFKDDGEKKPAANGPVEHVFDAAAIERPMPGDVMETKNDQGWDWVELSFVDQTAGGAPIAHRDALKLLAAFMQHTDSKPQQQRLVCLDKAKGLKPDPQGTCAHSLLMLNDVGRTFGRANMFNKDLPGSVDLKSWAAESIWKGDKGCTANISKSMTGTLEHPVISEGGRKFLDALLSKLSDQQIRDLFEVAQFTRRDQSTTVDDWVNTFKQKRAEIANRTCGS